MIKGLITVLALLCIYMLVTADWGNIYAILWWGLLSVVFIGLAIGTVEARVGKSNDERKD